MITIEKLMYYQSLFPILGKIGLLKQRNIQVNVSLLSVNSNATKDDYVRHAIRTYTVY